MCGFSSGFPKYIIMHYHLSSPRLETIRNKGVNLFFLLILIFSQQNGFSQKSSLIQLPHIFSDNMVIQQEINTSVWGNAKNTDMIVIEFAGTQTEAFVSQTDGSWMAKLPAFSAGGPYDMKVSSIGTNDSVIFHNVMIGEVWMASGQSNMQFGMSDVKNAAQEIKNANYPDMRFFQVDYNMSSHPLNNLKGRWKEVNPESDRLNIMATSSFIATVAIFDAMLAAIMKKTNYNLEQFVLIHPRGTVAERLNK